MYPHSARLRILCPQFRPRISHHLLGVEKRAAAQLNHLDLVSVPVGADSFAQIGGADGDGGGDDGSVALVDGWRRLCAQYFPRKATDAEVVVNLDELKLSAEPQLDQLVAQRESAEQTHRTRAAIAGHPRAHVAVSVPCVCVSVVRS